MVWYIGVPLWYQYGGQARALLKHETLKRNTETPKQNTQTSKQPKIETKLFKIQEPSLFCNMSGFNYQSEIKAFDWKWNNVTFRSVRDDAVENISQRRHQTPLEAKITLKN